MVNFCYLFYINNNFLHIFKITKLNIVSKLYTHYVVKNIYTF